MIRALLFPTVCLLVVPLLCGCDDEQAKQELEAAQKKAATSAAAAAKCEGMLKELMETREQERAKTKRLDELIKTLGDERMKMKKLEEYVTRQRETLVTLTNQQEDMKLQLTTTKARLIKENENLQTVIAENERLRKALNDLRSAPEKPAEE